MLAAIGPGRGRCPSMRMPPADSLADCLADGLRAHGAADLQRLSPVAGGCIHQAWCLELQDGQRLFAKTNEPSALPLLAAEADGLTALAAAAPTAGLSVPQPIALLEHADRVVLLLPWLALERDGDWQALGASLAGLHRRSLERRCGGLDQGAEAYGWSRDNYIGSGPQANQPGDDWGLFFVRQRLQPQLERLAQRGRRLRGAAALLNQVPHWLAEHHPPACLVHGDLWCGNAGMASGQGVIFDPAVYRGDREVDLAMARLFGGFPAAFQKGYEASWPLPAGHRQRVDLYNLYHLLNHANLFGGSYAGQAEACITRLLKSPPCQGRASRT